MLRTLCITAFFATVCATAQRKGITGMENDQLLTAWLSAASRADWLGYEPVAKLSGLPPPALADSLQWSERFFKEAANPHLTKQPVQAGIHRAHRDTPDLIRMIFQDGDIRIDYVEGANFVLLRLSGTPLNAAVVMELAGKYLNVEAEDHKWAFDVRPPLSDGARFSSSPATDPMNMFTWSSRFDGGIHNNQLFFLGYKKHSQRAGYKDGQRWFSGAGK